MAEYLDLQRRCILEDGIRKRLRNVSCHFEYDRDGDGKHILTIVTFNPNHGATFNLHTTAPQESKTSCLDQIVAYLDEIQRRDSGYITYTVTWVDRRQSSSSQKNTSYFSGRNFKEAMDKFYENKNPDDFVIWEVKQNPMS